MEAVVIAAFLVVPLVVACLWLAERRGEKGRDGEFHLTKAVVYEAILRAEQIVQGSPPTPELKQKLGEAKRQTERAIANWPQRTTRVASETDCTPCRTGGVQIDANVLFKKVVFYWERELRAALESEATDAADELKPHTSPPKSKSRQISSVVSDFSP